MPKPSYGERKRLTEKEKYRALAEIEYFVKKAEKLRAIPDQLDKETVISPKTREALNAIADDLVSLNALWKEYLTAYLDVTVTKKAEGLREREIMIKLLDSFHKITKQMDALEKDPVAEREEFAECYAEVQNYAGHYNEMTNGTLVVPEMTEEQKRKIITTKKELNYVSRSVLDGWEEITLAEGVFRSKLGYEDRFDTPLFSHEPTPDDVMQGCLGDCYFMASLASVAANNPQMIRDMMKDNGDGTVTVRLYSQNRFGTLEPFYVNVEKSVPVIRRLKTDGSQEVFDIHAKGTLWVQILEKAFAAANLHTSIFKDRFSRKIRSYTDLNGGYGSEAFRVLFGRQNLETREISISRNYSNTENPKVMDKLFEKIREGVVDKHIMTTAAGDGIVGYIGKQILADYRSGVNTEIEKAGKPLSKKELKAVREKVASRLFYGVQYTINEKTGLPKFLPHEYTLIDAYEKNGEKYVLVRDPHANTGYQTGKKLTNTHKGYREIPLKNFAGIFSEIDMAKPLEPKDYQDFSSEYHKPLSELYQGFLDTKTHNSQLMQWLSLSRQSRNLKNALREIEKIQEQRFPSKYAMMEAYKKLDKAAKAYLEKHKDDNVADMKDITNRRMTIARACLALSGSFLGHIEKERDVQADIHRIGRMMVTDRVMYVTQKSSENGQTQTDVQGVVTDVRVNKSLMPVAGDRLFDIALRTSKLELLGKVVNEVAKSKTEKQANPTAPKDEVKENVKQTETVVTK